MRVGFGSQWFRKSVFRKGPRARAVRAGNKWPDGLSLFGNEEEAVFPVLSPGEPSPVFMGRGAVMAGWRGRLTATIASGCRRQSVYSAGRFFVQNLAFLFFLAVNL